MLKIRPRRFIPAKYETAMVVVVAVLTVMAMQVGILFTGPGLTPLIVVILALVGGMALFVLLRAFILPPTPPDPTPLEELLKRRNDQLDIYEFVLALLLLRNDEVIPKQMLSDSVVGLFGSDAPTCIQDLLNARVLTCEDEHVTIADRGEVGRYFYEKFMRETLGR